jgi:hypothetical protein
MVKDDVLFGYRLQLFAEAQPTSVAERPSSELARPCGAALRVTAPHPAARGPPVQGPGRESRDRELELLNCDV